MKNEKSVRYNKVKFLFIHVRWRCKYGKGNNLWYKRNIVIDKVQKDVKYERVLKLTQSTFKK